MHPPMIVPTPSPSLTAETMAAKLKRLRTERKVSISVLAKLTGISRAYLSQLENGHQKNPSKDKLATLATFYRVSTNALVYQATGTTYEDWEEMSRRLTQAQRDEIFPILRQYASSNPPPPASPEG